MIRSEKRVSGIAVLLALLLQISCLLGQDGLRLNDLGYFEMPGLNVMAFQDIYPEGHQGGITLIQHGSRVAANGDVRLEPAPGQWQPVPKIGEPQIDRDNNRITVPGSYPNPDLDRKGFNPITYPDLNFSYRISLKAEGPDILISVDLDQPLPEGWIGKVGFNLELFPTDLFGKTYQMDQRGGLFPRQLNGPMVPGQDPDTWEVAPLATGKSLTVAPENPLQRLTITAQSGQLELLDGRAHHNNGWFIVRGPIPSGATEGAIRWRISAHTVPGWRYPPQIQLSQLGYHPRQSKVAVIECDAREEGEPEVTLWRIAASGEAKAIIRRQPASWGKFLRYQYKTFDFSNVEEPGTYRISYGNIQSHPFRIDPQVLERHVWQPTLAYFLPVQMCHMRINDRYRVWHGVCHLDDALMADTDTLHFDGYRQGPSTLTRYESGQHVPGLDRGGWHDAGDYDLRVESQAGTVRVLALMREAFGVHYDQTTVDQQARLVELHRPDGKLDILQQIEHGLLSIVGGYRNLGRLYRGIICPDLRQYVLLGDGSVMTDNLNFDSTLRPGEMLGQRSGRNDDRRVFTEENPGRELYVAACLAAAVRVMQNYNRDLSRETLAIAEKIWESYAGRPEFAAARVEASCELLLTTGKAQYREAIEAQGEIIAGQFERLGWLIARVWPRLQNPDFREKISTAAGDAARKLQEEMDRNPYGVPYRPRIWGPGWDIQRFAMQYYYLHRAWPERFSREPVFNALNFMLGVHPGDNHASFVSGVGGESVEIAYGTNRADWSYIPGGVVSGTGLVRPDLPELKKWPFFWHQTEYVIGGGATHFMFLTLAGEALLQEGN
ncbi:MAG TPA: glycoside hydrolase family 9 protein [Calditrichia bacterium]|nr:glycoside hydrolase family 9 protein [Calditrichota bacterium]HQU70645.1 glycoside hydrolase family 9 protein [Calditrichia bacterium]HQV31038.1 glycoside hydrolase family 9 protein [Calditrichia bacterium]